MTSRVCMHSLPFSPRVSLTILSALETQRLPWGERDPRVFFRGRDSNKARLELVKRHREDTAMFDVGIVAWFFFKHEEETYGPVANRVGFNDFFKVRRVADTLIVVFEWFLGSVWFVFNHRFSITAYCLHKP